MTTCNKARQARMDFWSSAKGFLSCSHFSTALYVKSCEPWGWGRKSWQLEAQQWYLCCWEGSALRHGLEQIYPSCAATCAWFVCLLLSMCLSALLNWILKCKAISCLWGAHGEMLGVSVTAKLYPAVYCLIVNHLWLTARSCKSL